MNVKKILVSGFLGGLVDFLLGWVLYGMLFKDIYSQNENTNLFFIFLGCITFGLFIGYLFNRWAGITNPMTGLKAGGAIGFFTSLSMNFFMYSGMAANYQNMVIDIIISIALGSCVGTTVAFVNGKLK